MQSPAQVERPDSEMLAEMAVDLVEENELETDDELYIEDADSVEIGNDY